MWSQGPRGSLCLKAPITARPLWHPVDLFAAWHDEGLIDRSGQWWKGEDFGDLTQYLNEFTAENYPADRIGRSVCGACGGTGFRLSFDDEEGGAQRTCVACGASAFLGDSEEYWDDAEPDDAECPCGGEQFEVGVAFSLRDDGDVRWITVGGRCVACGVLGVYTDWKIDYSPTGHLFAAV